MGIMGGEGNGPDEGGAPRQIKIRWMMLSDGAWRYTNRIPKRATRLGAALQVSVHMVGLLNLRDSESSYIHTEYSVL